MRASPEITTSSTLAHRGEPIAGFQLRIRNSGSDCYWLEWVEEGVVLDVGIGIEVAEGLAAGWRRISDEPPEVPPEF